MGIMIFKNEKFGEVKTIEKNNQLYFLANDVANILGYKRPGDAVKQHVDEEDRETLSYKAFGDLEHSLWQGNDYSNKTFISESGVYSLVFGSELPQAREFKRWITSDVLPSIRKHGAYMTEKTLENALSNPDFLIELATKLKEEKAKNKELEGERKILKPKADYYDTVLKSDSYLSITMIAQSVGLTSIELNKKLEELKIQYKKSGVWCLKREYINKGYTKVIPKIINKDGKVKNHTYWTEKGREFIFKVLKAEYGILPTAE